MSRGLRTMQMYWHRCAEEDEEEEEEQNWVCVCVCASDAAICIHLDSFSNRNIALIINIPRRLFFFFFPNLLFRNKQSELESENSSGSFFRLNSERLELANLLFKSGFWLKYFCTCVCRNLRLLAATLAGFHSDAGAESLNGMRWEGPLIFWNRYLDEMCRRARSLNLSTSPRL